MKLEKSIITSKAFLYKRGKVSLNFSLEIDNKSELINFRTCLTEAKKDIENILKEIK